MKNLNFETEIRPKTMKEKKMNKIALSPKASSFIFDAMKLNEEHKKSVELEISNFINDPNNNPETFIKSVERIADAGNGGAIVCAVFTEETGVQTSDDMERTYIRNWIERLNNNGVDQDGWPSGIGKAEKETSKDIYEKGDIHERGGLQFTKFDAIYVRFFRNDTEPMNRGLFKERLANISPLVHDVLIEASAEFTDPKKVGFFDNLHRMTEHESNLVIEKLICGMIVEQEKMGGPETDLGMRTMVEAVFFDEVPAKQAAQLGLDLEKRLASEPQDPFSEKEMGLDNEGEHRAAALE